MIKGAGYTLVELLVAIVVASIVLAAAMASYTIIASQNNRISTLLLLQEQGNFAMDAMKRHIRMANYMAPTSTQTNAIDAGNDEYAVLVDNVITVASDSLTVVYDQSATVRICVRFDVALDVTTGISQLRESRVAWSGGACDFSAAVPEPLVSNVETLQFAIVNNADGNATLVDIFLLLSSDRFQRNGAPFVAPQYEPGVTAAWVLNNLQNTRQIFSASVFMRNVLQ